MNGHHPAAHLNGLAASYHHALAGGQQLYSSQPPPPGARQIQQDRHNISPVTHTGRQSLPPDPRMPVASPPVGARPVPTISPPPSSNSRRTAQSSPDGSSDGRAGSAGVGADGKRQMLSRNLNGTLVMTTQPGNESELQLYRVLQRANLLNYYDTFISQGGDDVQQLCEAGEEEFLEIMALVGMASKPLHVRRLQKALQEWVQNPGMFQSPLVSSIGGFHSSPTAAAAAVIRASGAGVAIPTVTVAPSIMGGVSVSTSVFGSSALTSVAGGGISVSSAALSGAHSLLVGGGVSPHSSPSMQVPTSVSQLLAQSRAIAAAASAAALPSLAVSSPSPMSSISLGQSDSLATRLHSLPSRPRSRNTPPNSSGSLLKDRSSTTETTSSSLSPAMTAAAAAASLRTASGGSGGRDISSDSESNSRNAPSPPTSGTSDMQHPGSSTSPMQLCTPVLVESQIQRIADAAAALVKSLPDLEPKQPNAKKKICKELELVMSMNEEDEKKMEEIRKFSAIYGRFDCKRKPEKPLTLHEVSVNEAAAQICRLVPAMLTRRDELFPLARQVVRDSGYQYSKGHSRSTFSLTGKLFNGDDGGPFKRMRYSEDSEITQRRRERLDQITEESRLISDRLDELRTAGGSCRTGDIAQLQQISQQLELLQSKQQQLNLERDEHHRYIRYSSRMSTSSDPDKPDTDDDTSQRSYSNASSPSASNQAHNFVLSASGGQIIAVQNPALSLSGAFSAAASSVGRGSPPTTVQSSSASAGLHMGMRGTPPRHHTSSPAAGTNLTFKQEPSSPPPIPISYASQPPHSRD